MELDTENLVPDKVTSEEMANSWSEGGVRKNVCLFVRSAVGDVINKALLLQRNSLLDQTKITELSRDLVQLITYKEVANFEVHNYILHQLVFTGLNGAESDRDAALNILNHIVFESRFDRDTAICVVFKLLRRVLRTKFPSPEEVEAGATKKPGIGKMYYLRSTLLRLETDLRKILRASEMLAYFFLQGTGNADTRFIPRLFTELILSGDCPNLYSFYTICSILKTIVEKRVAWGSPMAQFLDNDLLFRVKLTLADFLAAYRVVHRNEPETLTFVHTIFTVAFRELSDIWDADNEYAKATQHETLLQNGYSTTEEYYWNILGFHYSDVYKLSRSINPRVFRAGGPAFFPGKPIPSEEASTKIKTKHIEIQDIGILLKELHFNTFQPDFPGRV